MPTKRAVRQAITRRLNVFDGSGNFVEGAIEVGGVNVPFWWPARGQAYPYGTFGPTFETKVSQQGFRVPVQLDFWSDYDGTYQIDTILEQAYLLITGAPLVSLEAGVYFIFEAEYRDYVIDERGIGTEPIKHGIITLNYRTNLVA